jgi:ABC-type uncharacterized transport system substrate-binding protein
MSYGVNLPYRWKLTASYVDKILKGAKPGNLPLQRPSVFEFAINMNTTKALGLNIPERYCSLPTRLFDELRLTLNDRLGPLRTLPNLK